MSVPSIDTDNTLSTTVDDDMSIIVNDSSDTTVATQTSASWHSVVSNLHRNNHLFVRSHSINTWLKICLIEPDIRLTTAQEWKLRACMRRLLSLCNLPLKISCVKTNEFVLISNENESIPFIDQEEHDDSSLNLSIIHPWLHQNDLFYNQLEQLGLYLHILSTANANNDLLKVKLFEFYSEKIINHIPLIKPTKFVFHISSNILKLTFRSTNSLLELCFSTRENESVRGNYYKWDEVQNEYIRFNTTVDIDQSLIKEFNIV